MYNFMGVCMYLIMYIYVFYLIYVEKSVYTIE